MHGNFKFSDHFVTVHHKFILTLKYLPAQRNQSIIDISSKFRTSFEKHCVVILS